MGRVLKYIGILLVAIYTYLIVNSYNYPDIEEQKDKRVKKVLFIGLDGFRRDSLEHFTELDDIDTYDNKYYKNTIIKIPISASSWTTIFTGLSHNETRITTNSFQGDKEVNNYNVQDLSEYNFQKNVTRDSKRLIQDRPNIKPIFYHLEENNIKSYIISAGGWDGIYKIGKWGGLPDDLNVRSIIRNDDDHPINELESELKAIELLKNKIETGNDINFFTLYTHNIDGNGHQYGHDPRVPEYKQASITTANNVIELIDYIKKREMNYNEDWLIISTTDHGGSARDILQKNYPKELDIFDKNISVNIGIDQRELEGIHGIRDDDFINNSNTDTWILIIKDELKYKGIDTTNKDITPTIIKYLIPSFNLDLLGHTHGNNLLIN